jgi:hypothetical protein
LSEERPGRKAIRPRNTGPRSAEGKRTSARNALQHGLSARKFQKTTAVNRIAELVDLIKMGFPTVASDDDLILQAAECQYTVEQVRALKAESLLRYIAEEEPPLIAPALERQSTSTGQSLCGKSRELDWHRLERYERRAFSRRQSVFRKLDQLRSKIITSSLTTWKEGQG